MLRLSEYLATLRSWLAQKREEGQRLGDYVLMLALVAIVALAALTGLSSALVTKLGQVTNAL